MRAKEFITERVSWQDLKALRHYLDKFYSTIGVDINFTNHFMDRVNDKRNIRGITVQELADLFKKEFDKYAEQIAALPHDSNTVFKDLSSMVNVPFVMNDNPKSKEKDLVSKTVMRKNDFKSNVPILAVENKK